MKITIEIDTGNAAFEDDLQGEVSRIMKQAGRDLGNHGATQAGHIFLYDTNGNRCGAVTISEA